MNHTPTESEVRALRDLVYGVPISDREWDHCKHNWMRPDSIAWLQEKAQKPMDEFLQQDATPRQN